MNVRVLFFGATAQTAGARETDLNLGSNADLGAATDLVLASYPELRKHRLLFALNEEYAEKGRVLADGDELAIFTAVSGG